MDSVNPIIEESWKEVLREEFQSDYFRDLREFLIEEREKHTIYQPGPKILNAFQHTPFDKIKVVILGQDPYHGPGQAHGLCFSVPEGVKSPPSLVNIFKEIFKDLEIPGPSNGNLERWADQGVFLLNATLTVRAGQAGSHQKRGWENFTDTVIQTISSKRESVIFLLWGRFAQAKENLIDGSKHLILKAAHPSPFSAYNGFFGCQHFSKANVWLKEKDMDPIKW
jgi:uracil-DNA glycosylase